MNISFFMTTDQIKNGTKTVTRRFGWKNLKPGEILTACVKCQGLKKGEKIEKLRKIRVLSVTEEPLDAITEEECVKEGFPEMKPYQYVTMLVKHYGLEDQHTLATRIEFEYVVEVNHVFTNHSAYCNLVDRLMEFKTPVGVSLFDNGGESNYGSIGSISESDAQVLKTNYAVVGIRFESRALTFPLVSQLVDGIMEMFDTGYEGYSLCELFVWTSMCDKHCDECVASKRNQERLKEQLGGILE